MIPASWILPALVRSLDRMAGHPGSEYVSYISARYRSKRHLAAHDVRTYPRVADVVDLAVAADVFPASSAMFAVPSPQ